MRAKVIEGFKEDRHPFCEGGYKFLAHEVMLNKYIAVNDYMFSTQTNFDHRKYNSTDGISFEASLEDLADHCNCSIHLYSISLPKVDHIHNRYVMEGKKQLEEDGFRSKPKISSRVVADFNKYKFAQRKEENEAMID